MNCPTCKRGMTQLFLSEVCDHCDFGPPETALHRGFVVWFQGSSPSIPHEEYVFRTPADAEKWREAAGRGAAVIREAFAFQPFRWHLSRGTLRDVVLADHLFEIFYDHKFEPLPHRAFLKEPKE